MKQRSIQRRDFLKYAGVATAMAAVGRPKRAAAAGRPNFVVILADDQGWGDLSAHGNTNISTPNIDSLARDGAIFDRFFVCPVCAPTRAEFLTGRYYSRCGVRGVSTGQERMNTDEVTMADTLKAAGYATGAFGKWHNGTQWPYHPNARGFDEYYGFTSGHWGHYFDTMMDHNGTMVRGKGYITDDLTNRAMAFIEEHKDDPFFCYIPYNVPHSPMQVPDKFFEKFGDMKLKMMNRDPKEDIPKTRAALAMCENVDWNVGRVLAKLDEFELAEDTVVLYFSDNGPNSWRWNDNMKGRKGSPDEGGLRVPCMVRWPGKIKRGTKIPQIAGAIDLLPTFADIADVTILGDKPRDGKSVKPLLLGTAGTWPDRMIFTFRKGGASVRTQQYRLDPAGHLFDMVKDPGQYNDIAKERPKVAARLQRAAQKFLDEVRPTGNDDRPFPIGYVEMPATLPARDGKATGTIKRSNRAPNNSFYTNWTSTNDAVAWDVEAVNAGKYAAAIYYTCKREDVGVKISLDFKGARIESEITEAHDPPLVGAAFDRSKRGSESYQKDFKRMELGTVRLKKGRGPLTLRATKIPGGQAMDVLSVVMTYLPA